MPVCMSTCLCVRVSVRLYLYGCVRLSEQTEGTRAHSDLGSGKVRAGLGQAAERQRTERCSHTSHPRDLERHTWPVSSVYFIFFFFCVPGHARSSAW